MFGGRKDVFYSFMAQDHINWRRLIYRMSVTLVSSITCRKDFKKSHLPAVLIADDSDLPKTGFRMEAIGKIFSHMNNAKGAMSVNAMQAPTQPDVKKNTSWVRARS